MIILDIEQNIYNNYIKREERKMRIHEVQLCIEDHAYCNLFSFIVANKNTLSIIEIRTVINLKVNEVAYPTGIGKVERIT